MKISRGFTIVELIITITILAILMTLAVVNLRSTQVQARDAERKADISAMAKRLDTLYTRGFPAAASNLRGSYPTVAMLAGTTPTDIESRTAIFKDLPASVQSDPLKSGSSIMAAANTNTGTTSGSGAVAPFPNKDRPYIYQPISDTGTLCTDHFNQVCRKFNLYSWLEATPNTAHKIESQYR